MGFTDSKKNMEYYQTYAPTIFIAIHFRRSPSCGDLFILYAEVPGRQFKLGFTFITHHCASLLLW